MGRTNVLGGSNKLPLNIYQSNIEPQKKKGLWIKTNKKYDNFELSNAFLNQCDIMKGQEQNFNRIIGYKHYIYLFYQNSKYRYDMLNNTITQLQPSTLDSSKGGFRCIIIDDYIYEFLGKKIYKYSIKEDTYSSLTDSPIDAGYVAKIGTNIYIINIISSTNFGHAYKYDTITNLYTRLSDLPLSSISSSESNNKIYNISNYLYLYGLQISSNNYVAYKYNIEDNTYTQINDIKDLRDITAGFEINNKLYYFNIKSNSYGNVIITIYEYRMNNDDIEKVIEETTIISIKPTMLGVTIVDNIVYVIQKDSYGKYVYYKINLAKENVVYLKCKNEIYNINNIEEQIGKISIFENYDEKVLEAYYGDGEKWNLL